MLLVNRSQVEILYSGDRMWPSVPHGTRLRAERPPAGPLPRGTGVIAAVGGIPDLYRLREDRDGTVLLGCDSVPDESVRLMRNEVLAVIPLKPEPSSEMLRAGRRMLLDLREALHSPVWTLEDPAESVKEKYEYQAPFYAASHRGLGGSLSELILDRVPREGRILVIGSGSGSECFGLDALGYRVCGIDFSPANVELARASAARRAPRVEFRLADLRSHEEPPASCHSVLFTADVYSFIPRRGARVCALARLKRWLVPGGGVFLSARTVRTRYQRLILTLQWLRHRGAWGDSHSRWITGEGALNRGFVHLFVERTLAREFREAGYRFHREESAGYWFLRPATESAA